MTRDFRQATFSASDLMQRGSSRDRSRSRKRKMKPGQPVWFVTPHDTGWAVKRKNAMKPTETFDRKKQAVRKGKRLAKRNNGQLKVMDRNGRFDYERTYGHDPRSRRG